MDLWLFALGIPCYPNPESSHTCVAISTRRGSSPGSARVTAADTEGFSWLWFSSETEIGKRVELSAYHLL